MQRSARSEIVPLPLTPLRAPADACRWAASPVARSVSQRVISRGRRVCLNLIIPMPQIRPSFAASLLFGSTALAQLFSGVFATLDPEVGHRFGLLASLLLFSLTSSWWVHDRRRVGLWAGLDAGLFLGWSWPLLLPYHLIRTRRWRGVGIMAAFVAVYCGCFYIANVATYALYSRRR